MPEYELKDKLSFLIAEDNNINLFFLKTLIKMNYPQALIYEAETGDKVIELLNENINLLFLDLSLPEKDGYEIVKYMKAVEKLKNIPIIILTATDCKKAESRLNNYGIKTYIRKPASKEIILDAINKYLVK